MLTFKNEMYLISGCEGFKDSARHYKNDGEVPTDGKVWRNVDKEIKGECFFL